MRNLIFGRFSKNYLNATCLFIVLAFPTVLAAALPSTINYQGYLTDPDGVPLDGTNDISFLLYSTEKGASLVWGESQNVSVSKGLFSVELGASNPIDSILGEFNNPLYLGIQTSYAIKAGDANTLEGNAAAELDETGDLELTKVIHPSTI